MILEDSDSVGVVYGRGLASIVDEPGARHPVLRPELCITLDEAETSGQTSYQQIMERYAPQDPGVEVSEDDLSAIVYTSGTTGHPKGVVHCHGHRTGFAMATCLAWEVSIDSTVLISTPLYHNAAASLLLPALLVGGTAVLMEGMDPEGWLETVQGERITHTVLVPTQFVSLMGCPEFHSYDLSSLEIVISTGAPMTRKTKEDVLAHFPRGVSEVYGLTEGIATILEPSDFVRKAGSVGKPASAGDIRVVDEDFNDVPPGEIGEVVGFNPGWGGYYKQPELTARTDIDGWLRTGDLGRLDDEGFLYLVGRKKDLIVSGGMNIYPEDIEDVLLRHPNVLEACVFGIPHPKWGESPMAAVILKEDARTTEDEIIAWTNARVAGYQKIRGVSLTADFPRNSTGKVLKRQLRQPYWEDHEEKI